MNKITEISYKIENFDGVAKEYDLFLSSFSNEESKKFKSEKTLNEVEKIAEENNVSFICRDMVKTNNAWYQFNGCKHIKSISRADVKRGKHACKVCSVKYKYVKTCEDKGLEYINHFMIGVQSWVLIKCKCDEILEVRVSSITHHDSIQCQNCKEINWQNICSKYGFDFVCGVDAAFATYKCTLCSTEQDKRYSDMRNGGVTCNHCNSSKSRGHTLMDHQIKLILPFASIKNEKTFKDLRSGAKGILRYDSAVYYEDNLLFIAEFDGNQHYNPNFYINREKSEEIGLEKFKQLQENDITKNEYCEKNNIPLIRITEDDIKKEHYKKKIFDFIGNIEL